MTILVTGGAGFIGGNFIYYMLKNHPTERIVCVDSLTYAGHLSTLALALSNPQFQFYQADICERKQIFDIFATEKPEIVINFAAESHVDRSIENPELFLKTNVLGAQVLMDASLQFSVRRFHQVSTDEVYGDLPLDRPDLLFTEQSPLRPSSPYSASKASADLLVQAYIRTFALPATISRCSNNYGPYQLPEKLIPLMITNCYKKQPLPVYGKGLNIRDWLYVEDHCRAIDLIIRKGRIGEIYNIGGHTELRNIDIVKYLCKVFNQPESLISYVADRKGHDLRYALQAEKIQQELGWMPQTKFEEGIQKTILWYQTNSAWWEEIIRS